MHWLYAGLMMSAPIAIGELFASKFKSKEHARKFVHITAGVLAALLPVFLTLPQIVILALVFTPPMMIAKWKSLMKSMIGVSRKTYGEILFSLGVAAAALISDSTEMYVFGVLVMALSDGFAGLIGASSSNRRYKIFMSEKSFVGSLTFFLITFVIGIGIIAYSQLGFESLGALLLISALLTTEEAALPLGIDNLFVPATASALFGLMIL